MLVPPGRVVEPDAFGFAASLVLESKEMGEGQGQDSSVVIEPELEPEADLEKEEVALKKGQAEKPQEPAKSTHSDRVEEPREPVDPAYRVRVPLPRSETPEIQSLRTEAKNEAKRRPSPSSEAPMSSAPPDAAQAASARPPGNGARALELLSKSAGLQLAVFALVGVLALVVWSAFDSEPDRRDGEARSDRPRGRAAFPKLEIDGIEDPINESDVERLFRARDAARAREETRLSESTIPMTSMGERTVLEPGMIVDPDVTTEKRIVIVGPSREGAAATNGRERSTSGPSLRQPREREVAPRSGDRGRFFSPGGLLEGTMGRKENQTSLGLSVGEKIPVELVVGITSSVREEVLATVTADVVRNGERLLKKGDILKGRPSNDDARVFIRFQGVLTSGKELRLAGYAVDGEMPGLVARRREATFEERSRGRAAGGALEGAAREIGNILAGASVPGRVAKGAAEGTLSEAEREVTPEIGWVLEVPAGRKFDVVVTSGSGGGK